MRSYVMAAVILALPMFSVHSEDPAPAPAPTPTRKIQKMVIVNLAWDSARAADVELGIKQELLNSRVVSESLRALTQGDKKPTTVAELTQLIKSGGYDSILCVGVRKTMQIMAADRSMDFPTMDSCLTIFLTGKYPSGQSLRSEPFVVDAQPTSTPETVGETGSQRTPIASNPSAAPITYYKRTLRLFDASKQTLLWEKKIMVKLPADLQGPKQAARIAREAAKALEQSGLLP